MFVQLMCQPTSPFGLNMQFGYFSINYFFVKGWFELYKVDFKKFNLVSLLVGVVLRFCQGVLRN